MHSFPLSSLIIWVFLTQEFKRGQLNKIILYFIMADLKTYSGSLSDHIMWINVQTGLKLYAGWQDKFIKHMQYLTFLKCWHLIYVWTRWSLFASLVPLQLLEVSFFLSENCELMYWFFLYWLLFFFFTDSKGMSESQILLLDGNRMPCQHYLWIELLQQQKNSPLFHDTDFLSYISNFLYFSDNTKSVSG